MKLGVLQGRLTAPARGHYQEFPKQWFSEFDTIQRIGLHGIEWLITKDYNFNNPIYTSFDLIQNLPVMSICVDTLVDERIINKDFLFHSLFSLCNTIKDSKMNVLTIPILDESDLNNDLARAMFCEAIQSIGQAFPRVKFAFESEMSPEKLNEIVTLCNNFYVTYDTGNITSCGVNHEEFINFFGKKIINVHLKDRTFDRKTVAPTTGDTDFELIFKNLSKIGYDGPFILQTARAATGQEIKTITEHKTIFEELYERHF
jgi:L-ribulose-5-phosphate 3-epimerase